MKRAFEEDDNNGAFSDEQLLAINTALDGSNVCILGPAGTGKSYIINTIRAKLQALGKSVHIVAPTGIAAAAIGGSTLHSWAGVGLGNESVHQLVRKAFRFKNTKDRWKETDALIIDEVSMVHPYFFEKLNVIGKSLRRNPCPFGGIQLILVGDFFQLPPVSKTGPVRYLFEDSLWEQTIKRTITLTKVFRQQDPTFLGLLQEIRHAEFNAGTVSKIQDLAKNKLENDAGIKPTKLFCRVFEVERDNQREYNKVEMDVQGHIDQGCEADAEGNKYFVKEFTSEDWFLDEKMKKVHGRSFRLAENIKLCNGAQVMLNWNIDVLNGRSNGTRCVVLGLDENGSVKVRFLDGTVDSIPVIVEEIKGEHDLTVAKRVQVPLRYAWSLTVHKSQGMTIDLLSVDLRGSFCDAMVYVALSRGRTLANMQVINFHPKKVTTSKSVKDFYSRVTAANEKFLSNKRAKLGAILVN